MGHYHNYIFNFIFVFRMHIAYRISAAIVKSIDGYEFDFDIRMNESCIRFQIRDQSHLNVQWHIENPSESHSPFCYPLISLAFRVHFFWLLK